MIDVNDVSPIDLRNLYKPSSLNLIHSGMVGWNTILTGNMEMLNLILPLLRRVLMSATQQKPSALNVEDCAVYFVPKGGTGLFQGHDGELVTYDPSKEQFIFFYPFDGMTFFCLDDDTMRVIRVEYDKQGRFVSAVSKII